MNTDKSNQVTKQIIGASYNISNQLGAGFLEKVYENALVFELRKSGLYVEQQRACNVYYKNQIVGEYYADLLVQRSIIVELKVAKQLKNIHQAQLMNYLKASKLHLGLLINFGQPKVEIKRILNGYK